MSRRDLRIPRIVFAGGHEGGGSFPDHRHEQAWELVYLLEGSVTERSGEQSVEMDPGTFVVHPPGTVHGDSASDRYFLYHVLLSSDQPLAWPRFGRDLEGAPLQAILAMVVREWYSNGVHREAFLRHCASMLDILMKRCALQTEGSQVARNVVTTACGYFRREFSHPVSLKEVARDLGISRSTLYTYFEQVLGRTPQHVLDGIRLKHAVYLLKHSRLSIAEVAEGAGYCSSSHLGRKLRATYNMTASQIRTAGVEGRPDRHPNL